MAAIVAFVITISSMGILGFYDSYRSTQIDYRGPLDFAYGWEEDFAEGEIPRPGDSPRLVMLENHRELRGTDADLAMSALRSSLEDRGWEIVDDPEVLAESIIDMPREGIANLDPEQIGVALESLDELSEKHQVETVLFVRTEGDDLGGSMEIEFWTDGVGRIKNLLLFPDSSRITTEDGQTMNAHEGEIDFMDHESRILRILQGEVHEELMQELGSSSQTSYVKFDPDRKRPITIRPARINSVKINPVKVNVQFGGGVDCPASPVVSNN